MTEAVATASGDAVNGWVVGVHDGDRHEVYTYTGGSEEEVKEHALAVFTGVASPPAPDPDGKPAAGDGDGVGLFSMEHPPGPNAEEPGDPEPEPHAPGA